MNNNRNFYQILGLEQNASSADIKRVMINLVDEYRRNPIKTNAIQQQAQQVKHAYEVLIDPKLRAQYDAKLRNLQLNSGSELDVNDQDFNDDKNIDKTTPDVNLQDLQELPNQAINNTENNKTNNISNINRCVVLHVVTTSDFNDGYKIIALSALELINNAPTGKTFSSYLNPELKKLDKTAFKSGLTIAFLKNSAKFIDISDELFAFINNAKVIAADAKTAIMAISDEFANCNQVARALQIKNLSTIDILDLGRNKHPKLKPNVKAFAKKCRIKQPARVLEQAQFATKLYLALIDHPYKEPQLDELDQYALQQYQEANTWVRFFARTNDFTLYNLIVIYAILFLAPDIFDLLEATLNKFSMAVYGLLGMLLEIIIYAIFKTTLFKAMLNVRAVDQNYEKLSVKDYALRNFRVYTEGMFFNIPPIGLVAQGMQYNSLRKLGYTSYDKKLNVKVLSNNSKLRLTIAVLVFISIVAFFVLMQG